MASPSSNPEKGCSGIIRARLFSPLCMQNVITRGCNSPDNNLKIFFMLFLSTPSIASGGFKEWGEGNPPILIVALYLVYHKISKKAILVNFAR